MRAFPLLSILLIAGCAQAPSNAEYQKNLATAKAVMQAHIDMDYDAWLAYYADDAVVWDAPYGTDKISAADAAVLFATHHDAFDGISMSREVWLPGVDTLNLQADGSVRAYINWAGTSKINGKKLDLRAYHYWNFNGDGKITQQGDFYDAGGVQSYVMGTSESEVNLEEATEVD
jgi:ketosteroid isomerase-like protein